MKRSFKTALVATAAALTTIPAVVWLAEPEDSHHGVRYQLWKRGHYSFRSGFVGAFMADVHRDSMVLGRSRADLERTFPPLSEGRKNERYWGEVYARFRPGDQFLWLWSSNWLVVLRDGRAIYLNYLKG
jgi:hypothetical protein